MGGRSIMTGILEPPMRNHNSTMRGKHVSETHETRRAGEATGFSKHRGFSIIIKFNNRRKMMPLLQAFAASQPSRLS